MGISTAPPPVGNPLHLMSKSGPIRIPVFPLAGALLFPRSHLPLHIFEPRYRAMVQDALASDAIIGMVQPKDGSEPPPLFEVGCLGRISEWEELEDGRFNIVLEGVKRFRILRELDVSTPFRQFEVAEYENDDRDPDPLASIQRADVERESKRYADALGYAVDWRSIGELDDEALVNGICQIAPLDVGSKQALLEAGDLAGRADLLVQFMQFQRLAPGGAEEPETLQ